MEKIKATEILKEVEESQKAIIAVANFALYEDGNNIVLKGTTGLGDKVEQIFYNPKKKEYSRCALSFWETYNTEYLLLEEGYIYYPANIFWTLYKKICQSMAKNIGSKLYINDVQYKFPSTNFYLDGVTNQMAEKRGVYGIYYKDDLIYIGSTCQGFQTRWKEHVKNFKDCQVIKNAMYRLPLEDISFAVLFSGEEFKEVTRENMSSWMIEFAEWCFIKAYKPPFNIAGNTENFKFHPSIQLDIPEDYWQMLKNWLVNFDTSEYFYRSIALSLGIEPEELEEETKEDR